MKKWKKSNGVMCAVMTLVCVLLCFLPEQYENASTRIPRASVRIEEVQNDALYPVGIVYSGVQNCRVTVLGGTYKGESAWTRTSCIRPETTRTRWCRWATRG